MSGKDLGGGGPPTNLSLQGGGPPSHSQPQSMVGPPPAHISQQGVTMTIGPGPVDLVKSGNSLAQIRIPSVSGASIQRVPVGSVSTNPLTRPTIIAPQVSVVAAPGRPMVGGVTVSKPALSVSNITMLPNTGRVTSLAQVRPGTRPVLAAPPSARHSLPQSTRPSLSAPMIRGAQVQSILPGQLVTHQVRPTVSSSAPRGPRPATVVPVGVPGSRQVPVTMTAVSFRPVARPTMDSRGMTSATSQGAQTVTVSKSMLSPGIKPLTVQQSHLGLGISPQVGVASQVALKHGGTGPMGQVSRSTATLSAGTARMVSPTPLVSLTPATHIQGSARWASSPLVPLTHSTHIQVPMVPSGPKPRVQRIVASSGQLISTTGGPVMTVNSTATLMSSAATYMAGTGAAALMTAGSPAALLTAGSQAALMAAGSQAALMTAGSGGATFITSQGGPSGMCHFRPATLIATAGPPLSSAALGSITGGGTVQITTPRTITLPYSGAHIKPGLSAASAASIPIARVTPQQSQPRDLAGSSPGFVYLPVTRSEPGGPRQVPTNLSTNIRSAPDLGGASRGDLSGHGGPPTQSAPVNLTISDRNVRVPAMTMPSFTPTIRYDTGRSENSVTITTLPPGAAAHLAVPGGHGGHQDSALHVHTGPATLSPAKITPVMPTASGGPADQDKQVPGSPRPSILRKRDGDGTPIKSQPPSSHTPPSSRQPAMTPPARPDSSSGSSTVSAPSSAALSGDEHQTTVSTVTTQMTSMQELTPRKKPRKQQLPPTSTNNVSPEWMAVKREIGARDRMEWEEGRGGNGGRAWEEAGSGRAAFAAGGDEPDWGDRVKNWQGGWGGEGGEDLEESGKGRRGWGDEREGGKRGWGGGEGGGGKRGGWGSWDSKETDQADDEEEMTSEEEKEKFGSSILKGKPRMSLKDNKPWKSRHNHFLRHSDVKPKDEKKPTVNELANQKYVYQKINGWKVYHLSAGMEDIIDGECEISRKLEEISQKLENSANEDVSLTKILELLKANIQRSKVIQEQLREAKQHSQNVFSHKSTMQSIILKYHNKRTTRRTEK